MKTFYQEENVGVTYERSSNMHGGGWYSYERSVNPGDVRVINKILSKAWLITRRGILKKPRVHWIAVKPSALRDVSINERPEDSGESQ